MESQDEIFVAARAIADAAEQRAYLSKACGEDLNLRERVEAMLRDAQHAEEFFGENGTTVPIPLLVTEGPGTVIGRYKLLQRIGEGGMGVVYMAEQREPVTRRVALKIIKLGMDTRQVVGRFEAERQALALMDHPNIARVLDAGSTETGRPYFVMELVRGIRITEYCDQNTLSTAQRLSLFIQTCHAVQHAHQKGIIHRDIKPSNILIADHDGVPVPKIIDFGIAKATTDQRLTDKTVFTAFEQFIGTPVYMSPEQARFSGLDVDTRTDIYSLGVLLYELLTGKPPFDEKELVASGLDECRRTICEKEPVRPSTALGTMQEGELSTAAKHRQTDAPRLVHLIRGDLDWIVMKCLEKDRSRRYETANGLAMDIQRHLNNEPIVARPPSAAYRFQKLVRRNKLKFATAAFAVSVLLLAVLVSTWQAIKATRAERKAREQATRADNQSELARAAKDFLIKQVLGVNPYMEEAPDPNRRVLIEKVDRAIGTQFTNQPQVEAELRYALGDAFTGIGDRFGMMKQIERVYEIRRQLFGITNSDTLWALASTAENYLNGYDPGKDRKEEAEKLLQEGLAIVRAAPHPLSSGEAEVLCVYAELRFRDGFPAEAAALMDESISVAKQTADPNSWRFQNKLMWLARLLTESGRMQEAEAMLKEQIRYREATFGPEHPITAQLLRVQGTFFKRQGRFDAAASVYERIVPIYRRSIGTNNYATCYVEAELATMYELQRRLEDAKRLFRTVYPRLTNTLSFAVERREMYLPIADFFVRNTSWDDAKNMLGPLEKFFEQHRPSNSRELEEFWRFELLMSQMREQEGSIEDAVKLCRHAAEAGYAPAQYELGTRCLFGNGVPRNPVEAADWFRKDAEKRGGWPEISLSLLHAYGIGVARDQNEARRCAEKGLPLLRKAADWGAASGLNNLARVLAMHPVAEVRDGSNAVPLAQAAVAKTSRTNANYLDTLAAAWAETGDFATAAKIEKEAEARAIESGWNRRYYRARVILYEAESPSRLDLVNAQGGIEFLVADTVRNQGWPAAANFCRNHFNALGNEPLEWRAKATIFAYSGDSDWYCKAAGQALGLAQTTTNWESQLAILHAASCAPHAFTSAETEACNELVERVERGLARQKPPEQLRGRRAIGATQLRLGRASEALAQFETVLQKEPSALFRGMTMLFQSLCLQHLARENEARSALQEAGKLVETVLPGPMAENEWPLTQDQLTSLVLLREARASLTRKGDEAE
jgi:serine/threonine protein kinase